jgi:hypothetical protein
MMTKNYPIPAPARTLLPTTETDKIAVENIVNEESIFSKLPKTIATRLKRELWEMTQDWYTTLVKGSIETTVKLRDDFELIKNQIWNFSKKLSSALSTIYKFSTESHTAHVITKAISYGIESWYNSALDELRNPTQIKDEDRMVKKLSKFTKALFDEAGIGEGIQKMISNLKVDRDIFKTLFNRGENAWNEMMIKYEQYAKNQIVIEDKDRTGKKLSKFAKTLFDEVGIGEGIQKMISNLKVDKDIFKTLFNRGENAWNEMMIKYEQYAKQDLGEFISNTDKKLSEKIGNDLKEKFKNIGKHSANIKSTNPLADIDYATSPTATIRQLPKILENLAQKNNLGLSRTDIENMYDIINDPVAAISNWGKQQLSDTIMSQILQPDFIQFIFLVGLMGARHLRQANRHLRQANLIEGGNAIENAVAVVGKPITPLIQEFIPKDIKILVTGMGIPSKDNFYFTLEKIQNIYNELFMVYANN